LVKIGVTNAMQQAEMVNNTQLKIACDRSRDIFVRNRTINLLSELGSQTIEKGRSRLEVHSKWRITQSILSQLVNPSGIQNPLSIYVSLCMSVYFSLIQLIFSLYMP
jgi:hypothetical protein